MAASRIGDKVEEMDAIASRLTRTNLTEDDSRPATDPTAGAAEMEPIADSPATDPPAVAAEMKPIASRPSQADIDSEEVRQRQEAEAVAKAAAVKQRKAAAHKQKKADKQTAAALSAACDMWSITEDEGAKAKREAQEAQERIRQQHADHLQALEDAEARRQAEAKQAAVMKRLVEARTQARLDKKNREAEEARGKEAERQKQAEADALAVILAERRAAQEREWRQRALANQAMQEADNLRRQQLSQAYNDIIAHNAVLAEANAREWQISQQQRAEYLARYQALVSGQVETAGLVQQQQQQQHHHHHQHQPEQQQQQQQPSNLGSVVSEMEVTVEEDAGKGTEAVEEMNMDWEPVEKGTPLPAQTLVPSVPPTGLRNASAESEPAAIAAPPPASRPDPSAGPKKAGTLTAVSPKRTVAKAARRKDRARIKAARASSPPSAPPPSQPPPSPPPPSPPTRTVVEADLLRTPIDPVIRPTVHPRSPLGRLLSRGQSIPQVAQRQVLGKREREDMDEAGPEKKKAKLEGEFQSQVGRKRKREDEEDLPEKKRARLDPAPPTLAPPVVPATGVGPSTTPPTQPITAAIPLPANFSSGLAETIAFVNDLPTLRAEIAWMRSHRTLDNSGKATRGKKTRTNPIIKSAPARAAPGYWEKYREN